MNLFDIVLKRDEEFAYIVPEGQNVCFVFVYEGKAIVDGTATRQELIVFEATGNTISVKALQESRFLLATAIPHPYPVVTGPRSVHTNKESLKKAKSKIDVIGNKLRRNGKIN